MKPNKTADRIERALWHAGRSSESFAGGPDWPDKVMAEIRRIGPLKAKALGRVYPLATVWPWAAAVAACLVIGVAWHAFNDLNTDTAMVGLFLDDPADSTVNAMWWNYEM